MNIEETKKAIEVMQAFVDGKTIQHRVRDTSGRYYPWDQLRMIAPVWNWWATEYRVKPEPKEIWVNEYGQGFGAIHSTKENALDYVNTGVIRKAVHFREVIE